jgi:DNA-binding NarL/FixJ family response regulator
MTPSGPPTGQLRVLIADDQRPFAESVMTLLSEDERIDVIGIASSGEQAVELATSLQPDVVLMDSRLPELDGLAATRRIKRERVPVFILLMTGTDELGADDARRAGADAFLRKGEGLEELRRVFFEVASLTTLLRTSEKQS